MRKPRHIAAALCLALNTFLLFIALPVLFLTEEGYAEAPTRPRSRKILVPPVSGALRSRGPTSQAAQALRQALLERIEKDGIGTTVSTALADPVLRRGGTTPTLETAIRLAREVQATHVLQIRIQDHLRLDGGVHAVSLESQLRDVAEGGRLVWRGKSVRAFPSEKSPEDASRAEASKILALAFARNARYVPSIDPPNLGQIIEPDPPPVPTIQPVMAYNGTGEPGDSIPDRRDTRAQAIPPRSTFERARATDRPRSLKDDVPPAPTTPVTPAATRKTSTPVRPIQPLVTPVGTPAPTTRPIRPLVPTPSARPVTPPVPPTAPATPTTQVPPSTPAPRTGTQLPLQAASPQAVSPAPAAPSTPAPVMSPMLQAASRPLPPPTVRAATPASESQPMQTLDVDRSRLLEIATLYFPTSSSTLDGRNQAAVHRIAQALVTYPDTQVLIEGHTDSRGSEQQNYRLSLRRAEAVRSVLLRASGRPEESIRAFGRSENQLATTETSPADQARNRRAVIYALRPGTQVAAAPAPEKAEEKEPSPGQKRLQEILDRIRRTRQGSETDALDGSAQAASTGTPDLSARLEDDLVRPGDSLRVKVRGREELTRIVQVTEAGELRFPLVDRLPVAGKTIEEVEGDLSRSLEKYIRKPEIEVTRVYRVKVFGLVTRQGSYQFDQSPTIPEVLARAEGIATEPDRTASMPMVYGHLSARVVNAGGDSTVHDLADFLKTGRGLEGVYLRDGETLVVEYNKYQPITLLGTVKTTLVYRPGLRLLEAISLAGGLMDESKQNIKNIRVLRSLEDGKIQRLEVNLHDLIHRGQVNRDIELMPGDYVVVPRRSKRMTVFKAITSVLQPVVQVGLIGSLL